MTGRFRSFVILAGMRTGSKLLEEGLNGLAGLKSHGELFNEGFIGHHTRTEYCGFTLADRDRDPLGFLDRVIGESGDALPGFRLFLDHDPRVLDHVLHDESCAKIVLWRDPVDSYVSLALAQRTNRWWTGGRMVHPPAKVAFDKAGFDAHWRAARAFHGHIREVLLKTGQAACNVSYDDLGAVATYNGIAAYLGVADRLTKVSVRNRRQNSARRRDRVTEYAGMSEILAALTRERLREPDFGFHVDLPRPAALSHPGLPLLCLPLNGSGEAGIAAWLNAHAKGLAGTAGLGPDWQAWLDRDGRKIAFAVLDHPFPRAYRAFLDRVFTTSPRQAAAFRDALDFAYDLDWPDASLRGPAPDRAALEAAGHGAEAHRALFLAFLDFTGRALRGQTRVRPENDFAAQSAILQGFADRVLPERVIRRPELAEGLAAIERALGRGAIPLATGNDTTPFPPEMIHDAEIASKLREVYAMDFAIFGFDDWHP